jgi:protoporphyrin/coproporphyrin ferrochelatase
VSRPFDAVLVIAFGGPLGPADVRPFLANVLKGRRVPPERVEEVAHHYELFDGVSPLTELTNRQASGMAECLRARGFDLPVHVGMRNWHPYLADTLSEMSKAGIRRAIGFIAAAHRSYSGCLQYRENVDAARAEVQRRGLADVEVVYVDDWHTHPDFIAASAARVNDAFVELPETVRARAQLVFTAHSIPVSMAERYPYREQFEETARLVAAQVPSVAGVRLKPDAAQDSGKAEQVSRAPYVCVYQSRSGRPEDPWLGPDICDYLRDARESGLEAAVICPAGFICDHIEVLYDLDEEAATLSREIGLAMARAGTVNDHPRFLDMMADVVLRTYQRYERGRPLNVAHTDV